MLLSCITCCCHVLVASASYWAMYRLTSANKSLIKWKHTHTHTPWSVWQKMGTLKRYHHARACATLPIHWIVSFLTEDPPMEGGFDVCTARQCNLYMKRATRDSKIHGKTRHCQSSFQPCFTSSHKRRRRVSDLSASRGLKSVKSVYTSLALSFVAVSSHEDFRIMKLWPWSCGSPLNQLINLGGQPPYLTIMNAYPQPVRAIE